MRRPIWSSRYIEVSFARGPRLQGLAPRIVIEISATAPRVSSISNDRLQCAPPDIGTAASRPCFPQYATLQFVQICAKRDKRRSPSSPGERRPFPDADQVGSLARNGAFSSTSDLNGPSKIRERLAQSPAEMAAMADAKLPWLKIKEGQPLLGRAI